MSQLDSIDEAVHLRNVHWVPVPESGSCPASHPNRLQSPQGQTRCYTDSAAAVLRRRARESDTEFAEQERPPLKTQTYILSKERFKTQAEADKWMDDNDVPRPKVDEKENTFRYRQFDPDRCEEGSARTIRITDGVQIVGCRLKPEFREAITPFKDLPLAERTRAWDSGEAMARVRRWASTDDKIDFDRYSMAFLIVDGPRENLTSYKLPFADFFDNRLRAVPRGIFAAAAVLQGARGGIDLPSGDLTRAQNHLGQYYSKMELRPPWAPRESASEQDGMHETGIDFGIWLKKQREKLGITMAELARRSGMSPSMISVLEQGGVMRPDEKCLRAWAKFFGVSYEFLRDIRNKGLETGLLEADIQALDDAIREQVEKLTNERARLRDANADNPNERCGLCTYFDKPTICRIVEGPVATDLVCDWIDSTGQNPELYKVSDKDWLAFVKGMIDEQPYQHIVRDGAITPEGPVVLIEDTADPSHRFSLTRPFHIAHTVESHHWTQAEVDDLVSVGRSTESVQEDEALEEGIRPAFGSPGGKKSLAQKIVSLIPEHKKYVEPFIGGGAVFFAKKSSPMEILNDRDAQIIEAYRFIQSVRDAEIESLRKMPSKRDRGQFEKLRGGNFQSKIARFHRFLYLAAFSIGNARDSFSEGNGDTRTLEHKVERLPKLRERLAGINLSAQDFRAVIRRYDGPETFFYLDPPYPTQQGKLKTELTNKDILESVRGIKGKFILSLPNDADTVAAFKEYSIKRVEVRRTLNAEKSVGRELLISNFPMRSSGAWLAESILLESFRIDLTYKPEEGPTHEELESRRLGIMKKFEDFVKAEFPKGDIKVELENLIPKEMQEQDARFARFFLFDIRAQETLPDGRRGPSFKILKQNQVRMSEEDREIAMKAKAVWHHGSNGEATCAIWKSIVRGETWFVCNTHRAMNVRPTLKAAIKQFHDFIKGTA